MHGEGGGGAKEMVRGGQSPQRGAAAGGDRIARAFETTAVGRCGGWVSVDTRWGWGGRASARRWAREVAPRGDRGAGVRASAGGASARSAKSVPLEFATRAPRRITEKLRRKRKKKTSRGGAGARARVATPDPPPPRARALPLAAGTAAIHPIACARTHHDACRGGCAGGTSRAVWHPRARARAHANTKRHKNK